MTLSFHSASVSTLALASLVACGSPGSPIAGAWQVVERQYTRGDSSWTESDPQPSSWLFTPDGHYGVQEIRESGPRPLFTDWTTELERLAAFDVFHAHSGTWSVEGDTLWITLQLAKSPNTMTGETVGYAVSWIGPDLVLARRSDATGEHRITRLRRFADAR